MRGFTDPAPLVVHPIGKEVLMGRLDRFKKEANFTDAAKVVSVFFIIGVVLLLVAQPTERPGEQASAAAPVFAFWRAR
jgi:hypothetical protein